jgi:hypothetical protein
MRTLCLSLSKQLQGNICYTETSVKINMLGYVIVDNVLIEGQIIFCVILGVNDKSSQAPIKTQTTERSSLITRMLCHIFE